MKSVETIRQIICNATGGVEFLTFGGSGSRWSSLDDFRNFPDEPAVYALGLKLGVQYERIVSRIVYFGSTIGSLRNRIRAHATRSHNDWINGLSQRFPRGVEISFHTLRGIDRDWLRELEDAAMQEAFRCFGCFPICNVEPILAKHREACSGLVRILACDGLPFPQRLDSLLCGNGILNDKVVPEGGWSTYRTKSSGIRIVFSSLGADSSADSEQAEQNVPIPTSSETQIAKTNDVSPMIFTWNVALWSQEKMDRIVRLSQQLKQAKAYGQSKVVTFDAINGAIPSPDTWGEVALIKAREVAGTFYPETRLWLKVRFRKTLLGQAIFEPTFFNGEDKSDLPQTTRRDSIDSTEEWCAHVANIPAELPPTFQPRAKDVLQLLMPDTTEPIALEHLLLLRNAQAHDLEEAARQDAYERERELERIRQLTARRELDEQIEARYRAAMMGIKATC